MDSKGAVYLCKDTQAHKQTSHTYVHIYRSIYIYIFSRLSETLSQSSGDFMTVPIYTKGLCNHQLSLLICYLASQGRWKYEQSIDLNLFQSNVTVDKWVGTVIAP